MDIHQKRLIEAAEKLDIAVRDLSESYGMSAVLFERGGRQELCLQGTVFSSLSYQTDVLMADKQATKAILIEMGLPVPASLVLSATSNDQGFLDKHSPAVFKPLRGTEGQGIELGLTSLEEVEQCQKRHRGLGPFLLEEFVAGKDLRIQAIGGELVAACWRVPAEVVGDGQSSVQELIADRNAFIATQNPDNHIDIDHPTTLLLRRQGYTLESIPDSGVTVKVKEVANMSQGATAIDITDEIHPGYWEWVSRVAARFNIEVFSLDAITLDHTLEPSTNAKVLELNARPQWLHHTFSERRQHDIPSLLLKSIFSLQEAPCEL